MIIFGSHLSKTVGPLGNLIVKLIGKLALWSGQLSCCLGKGEGLLEIELYKFAVHLGW